MALTCVGSCFATPPAQATDPVLSRSTPAPHPSHAPSPLEYRCSHCNNQKVAFGAGGTRVINYVECAKDGYKSERDFCQEKGIKGYPTWEIDGKFYPGERSLEDLMALSGFSSATASK